MFLFLILILPSKFELDERLLGNLRSAADVERPHGELGAGLADRLRRDDADRLADIDRRAAGEIAPVALAADPGRRLAGQHRADAQLLHAGGDDRLHLRLLEQRALLDDDLVRGRIAHVLGGGAAEDAHAERGHHLTGVDHGAHIDAARGAAILDRDDRILRHVDQPAGQIARVGGLERGIGETLAGAVRRVEVLEHRQPFLEVRDDRALDDLAGGLGHQTAHAGELAHLRRRAARAGMGHHVDRVDLQVAAVGALLDRRNLAHHLVGDVVRRLRPGVDHLVVLLALRDQAVVVLLLELLGERAGLLDDLPLRARDNHVVLAERDAGLERVVEAERHDPVAEDDRLLLPAVAVDLIDRVGDLPLGHELVHGLVGDLRALGQDVAQHDATRGSIEPPAGGLALLVETVPAVLDPGVQIDRLGIQGVLDLGHVAEDRRILGAVLAHDREIVEAEHDVLRRHDDRRAVGRMQDIVGRHHQDARLELGFQRQRHVHRHLVAVEVGVERGADQRMQLDRLALDQHRLERLDAEAMQGRGAVEQHRMLADDLVEDVPDLGLLLLDQLLGLLDRGGETLGVEPRIDERLEQLERHLLGQPALVQAQFWTDHDHRAAGIVDALAEQVLPEPALLALEHVGQRLERPLVGAGDDPAAAAVVEQRVDRLLQHPLLVADDDVGGAQLDQPLQAVVAVDDPAVEVVEVGGGEATAVERHQRPQVGRNDRNDLEDHPFRLVAGLNEGLDQLEPLGQLLGLELGGRFGDLDAQVAGDLLQVEHLEHLADRLGADERGEAVGPVELLGLEILVLREQLTVLERSQARLDHHIALEVEDALQRLERHVEQKPDARGQRLQEPDMRDRRRQLDMPHALAPHARQRHLDRALLADDAFVLHALVLAAQALVVLDRAENARAEQAVALRLEGAVVDGLRLLDLAVGPGKNLLRARDGDPDLVEDLSRHLRAEKIHDLLIHHRLLADHI